MIWSLNFFPKILRKSSDSRNQRSPLALIGIESLPLRTRKRDHEARRENAYRVAQIKNQA